MTLTLNTVIQLFAQDTKVQSIHVFTYTHTSSQTRPQFRHTQTTDLEGIPNLCTDSSTKKRSSVHNRLTHFQLNNWPLAMKQLRVLSTLTIKVNNTTCIQTQSSIRTASKRFTVVFKNSTTTCFVYTTVLHRQPAGLSVEVCLYTGTEWPSSSVSQRVARD